MKISKRMIIAVFAAAIIFVILYMFCDALEESMKSGWRAKAMLTGGLIDQIRVP